MLPPPTLPIRASMADNCCTVDGPCQMMRWSSGQPSCHRSIIHDNLARIVTFMELVNHRQDQDDQGCKVHGMLSWKIKAKTTSSERIQKKSPSRFRWKLVALERLLFRLGIGLVIFHSCKITENYIALFSCIKRETSYISRPWQGHLFHYQECNANIITQKKSTRLTQNPPYFHS
jgi:hypothetical protein